MHELKTHLANVLGASWTAGILLEYLEGGVAIVCGLCIIWFNVEKAMLTRVRRKQGDDVSSNR